MPKPHPFSAVCGYRRVQPRQRRRGYQRWPTGHAVSITAAEIRGRPVVDEIRRSRQTTPNEDRGRRRRPRPTTDDNDGTTDDDDDDDDDRTTTDRQPTDDRRTTDDDRRTRAAPPTTLAREVRMAGWVVLLPPGLQVRVPFSAVESR